MEGDKISSNHAPCLWILVALIAGIQLSINFDPPRLLLAGIAIALSPLPLALARKNTRTWDLTFLIAAALAAWLYGEIRFTPDPPADEITLPPRITELTIKVSNIMTSGESYQSGIGKVKEATKYASLTENTRIYFQVSAQPEGPQIELLRGQTIRAVGVLRRIMDPTAQNPFEHHLSTSGIDYRFVQVSEIQEIEPAPNFIRWCLKQKNGFKTTLTNGAPAGIQVHSVYVAMLLGEKSGLTVSQRETFSQTGTMHLFAISGLHVGVIATVISQALLLLRVPSKLSPIIGIALLYLYVEITGAAPSAVRALIMVAFFWISFALSRQRSPFAALVASAFFVLIVDPWQVWQVGFQLSYLVVASIVLFGIPFYRVTWRMIRPFDDLPRESLSATKVATIQILKNAWMLASVSLAAWLASAPISASIFGHLAPYAILTNLFLVNLAALTITTGVISIGCSLLWLPELSHFLNNAAWVSIYIMESFVNWAARIPGASLSAENLPRAYAQALVLLFLAAVYFLGRSGERTKHLFLATPLIILLGLAAGSVIS